MDNNIKKIKKCLTRHTPSNCNVLIKKKILETKRSFPIQKDIHSLNFVKGIDMQHGMFNSDIMHGIIYVLLILEKHKNLLVPYRTYLYNAIINEANNIHMNVYRNRYGSQIINIIKEYNTIIYELTPYLIMWRDAGIYHIHKDLDFYILKCLHNKNCRFILFKLTLLVSYSSSHANIILYDKETGQMERFDPYGYTPYLEADKMDAFLENKFNHILSDYHHKNNLKFKYLSPKDYMKVGFQVVSDDSNNYVKKLGDPLGYCLAWCMWYIEMRVSNPNIEPKELVDKCFNDIITNGKHSESANIFVDFIRNYAGKLDKMKNKILLDSGTSKNRIYNIYLRKDEENNIFNHLVNLFKKITKI